MKVRDWIDFININSKEHLMTLQKTLYSGIVLLAAGFLGVAATTARTDEGQSVGDEAASRLSGGSPTCTYWDPVQGCSLPGCTPTSSYYTCASIKAGLSGVQTCWDATGANCGNIYQIRTRFCVTSP